MAAQDVPIRFEIVREARIGLQGRPDRHFGVPRLQNADRIAEKLLANADRCQDSATASRDAIDLGMLALHRGPFPESAWSSAEHAYGEDVALKLGWVLAHLGDPAVRRRACETLGMKPRLFNAAAQALYGEFASRHLDMGLPGGLRIPPYPRTTHLADVAFKRLEGGNSSETAGRMRSRKARQSDWPCRGISGERDILPGWRQIADDTGLAGSVGDPRSPVTPP